MSKYEPVHTWPNGRSEYEFPNGYGATVARERMRADTFLLGVTTGPGAGLTYDTTGPNGEYRCLSADEVNELLDRIAALPKRAD